MCNCRDDIEKKLLARFIDQAPQATGHQAKLQGYGFVLMEDALVMRGCMPFKLSAIHQLKNGGNKEKTSTQNMMFSFCPFCGEKFEGGAT